MILVWLYPLLFLWYDSRYSQRGNRRKGWLLYAILTAAAVFLCFCAADNYFLPNPIDGVAALFGQ